VRKGYEEVITYNTLHLGTCTGRAGICRQGGANREGLSSLLEKSEEGSTCCVRASFPFLHTDVKPRLEAAPGCSRGLAVFAQ